MQNFAFSHATYVELESNYRRTIRNKGKKSRTKARTSWQQNRIQNPLHSSAYYLYWYVAKGTYMIFYDAYACMNKKQQTTQLEGWKLLKSTIPEYIRQAH
jgi:hypothetical protein